MGGHHAEGAFGVECFKERFGNGAAAAGFGAAAQLVEEKEGALVGFSKQRFHVLQVRGVGGEVVVDALLVADVDGDGAEETALRGGTQRNRHAALEHILYQSHCLEQHRFAAGVGAGNDEDAGVSS